MSETNKTVVLNEWSFNIWRVRKVSFDGAQIGREWKSAFFLNEAKALDYMRQLIEESNKSNPKYPFETEQEDLDGVRGYCNWQFGSMITMDSVRVT
jgi:hypothetical protein